MYFLTLLMLLLPISANAQEIAPVDEGFICMDATTRAEEKHQIQKYLLTSISTVETGKWNKTAQQKMAWPWTINVRGKGHYYNMRFHGKEFASLEDAFDPEKNVEYAARFLKRLYDRRQDWMKAATDYHSRRPAKAQAYKKRLLASLETVKKGHRTYLAMYAAEKQATEEKLFAARAEEPKTKRSWLSRLLWGDDDEGKQDVKLSWRG